MTREEFYAAYGDVLVKFSSYYKYTFTFTGERDGVMVSVDVGGAADDIYRMEVSEGCPENVRSLQPYAGRAHAGDEEVASFYDF